MKTFKNKMAAVMAILDLRSAVLAIFNLVVILLLQYISTQINSVGGPKLVFKMAAMATILDFQ